ncbi:conserved oligomeric Golgi complex subunit 1 [Lycorma delicatula]|uniref:conserved oligomeric Golgi complex subunit 1 n=1 Tax=Lycorma delicatula TaxID=130591 RepID=UPI003F50EFD2
MPAQNLFEIDPDKLFELYTIEEIQSTQIKLQHEIERKREELRTMVGERYRDLIEAADKITEMKEISQLVIKDIEGVSSATDDLQGNNAKHFGKKLKQINSFHSLVNITVPSLESIAVQLKLLIELPEYIWTALDKNDFATATQLYMLGRHIKTGLEMDPLIRVSDASANGSTCPLLEQHWVAISQFKVYILKSVGVTLQQQSIDTESACGCFISVALLERMSSSKLVHYFLSFRTSALQNMVASPLQLTEDASVTKTRFTNSHTIIISTLMTLYSCFIESPGDTGDGVLWKTIRKTIGRESVPVINTITSDEWHKKENKVEGSDLYNLLPSVINNYRCSPESTLEPLPPNEMSTIIADWLTTVTQLIRQSGKVLLDKLSSLRCLQGLRDANQELPEEWSIVLQRLMQPSTLNIWNDLYMPLIINRAKQLITVHWKAGLKHIKQQITSIIKEITSNYSCKTPENDLRWYIWKESANDILFSAHRNQHQQSTRGVQLKSQGITPRVADLCGLFETQLSTLLNDLSTLNPSCDNMDTLGDNCGNKSLQSHQQTQCLSVLSQLVQYIKNEVGNSEGDVAPLFFARFLQSIINLCPTLQKHLTVTDSKVNVWQEACNILTSETNHCWSVWCTRVLTGLDEVIASILLTPKQLKDLLNIIPRWDLVSIEEEGEAGQTISSELRVPSSPSFQLLSILSSVCTNVSNALVPFCVTELLVNELVVKILGKYKTWVTTETPLICQSQLWQQLFDVKYIAGLLVQHDNKPLLSVCQDVIGDLEKNIDPFDLDVFTPYINDNIKRSQRQTQAILGVLVVSRSSTPYSAPNTCTTQSHSNTEDPSVLAVSASASSTWFPLLPVTAPPGTRAINPTKVKMVKNVISTELQQQPDTQQLSASSKATAAVASTASSFFGSMTSDWFG